MTDSRTRCVIAALALAISPAALAPADVTGGLIAHWALDEIAPGNVHDSAGAAHGANKGADVNRPGLSGTAYRFNSAEDDFLDLGDSLRLDPGNQLTIAAVVKPESFNPPDFNRANGRNGILGTAGADIIFALTDRGRPTFIWDAGVDKYQPIITDPAGAVPLGAFSHVAVTRDGPTMTLYINGVARKTESRFSPDNFVHLDRMHIGRVNGTPSRDFDGIVDDVRVYDRPLSPEEVWQLAGAVNLAGVELPKAPFGTRGLERMKYNNPGLVVDLGVGLWAWPLPMDYDGDGDLDLVVSCADKPFNATCFFENPGGDAKMPLFKPPVVIGPGLRNCQIAYIDGQPRVTIPGYECVDFLKAGFDDRVKLPVEPNVHPAKIRANQWKYVDYDGDGRLDLVVGVGDWTEYGWDNAFNAKGEWTNGPLRGFVYLLRNTGSTEKPEYAEPLKIEAGGRPLEVYGMPSPNLADFDGDGDLDIICGEFVDKFTWFENVGTRKEPKYAAGGYLSCQGKPLRMDLCMIVPVAVDWDSDGDVDLVVGQEDGRVALVDNTGTVGDNGPVFSPPKFFRQEADEVKFGALVTPVSFDWDADGDEDLICGNTAGYVGLIENLDGGNPPKWAEPVLLEADGDVLRIQAGPNGSIQGPCEAKWGYTTLSVADWDHDGLADLVVNSIWGKVVWYRNVGQKGRANLAAAAPIEVQWQGPPPKPAWNWWDPEPNQLATQWRTTPLAHDLTGDGLVDLIMLDHEGYLALFERRQVDGRLVLLAPKRVFRGVDAATSDHRHVAQDKSDGPLRLNAGVAGRSGRRKFCLADWDLDGKIDILVNSRSIDFLKNVSTDEKTYVFANTGPVDSRVLAGHTTSPTVVDWDRDGSCDLLVGAEDGYFYYLKNPRDKADD